MDELEKIVNNFAVKQAELITRVEMLSDQVQETKSLVESVHKLALGVQSLTEAQKNTTTQLNRLQCNVDEIQSKPAKRWDSVQMIIITAILSGLIGFALKAIFP